MKARRGDLVAVETHSRYFYTGKECEVRTHFEVGVVTSITREGVVKKFRGFGWDREQDVTRSVGFVRCYVMPREEMDLEGVEVAVKAHTYPNSTTPMAYESLEETREALRPFKRQPAAMGAS